MNSVVLIGRLTADIELSYTATGTARGKFTLAVDRPTKGEKTADFIRITAWSALAERCAKYLAKGNKCAVQGRIETGSYKDREGKTVYTTDVVANTVEFLQGRERLSGTPRNPETTYTDEFTPTADDIPF